MYALYIANKNYSSWSLRPWALMRERGIPFEERRVLLGEGSNWDAYRTFSPNGRVPCLIDGGTAVWESLAIAEYLAERHEGVWPDDPGARAWARCAAAEMHAGFVTLRDICTMNVGIRVRLHAMPPGLARDVARIAELWNEGLGRFGGPFLGGNSFTAADAFFAPVAYRVRAYSLALDGPAAAYAERLLALSSLRDWETAALAETAREPGHEDEARRAGEWLEDRRATAP
jgi:glutathione S-transferase